jgi:hypothetical protein
VNARAGQRARSFEPGAERPEGTFRRADRVHDPYRQHDDGGRMTRRCRQIILKNSNNCNKLQ